MNVERFVESMPGKAIVGPLTALANITVIKRGDKTVTPLDTLRGTVISGLVLLGALLLAVRIAAIVS